MRKVGLSIIFIAIMILISSCGVEIDEQIKQKINDSIKNTYWTYEDKTPMDGVCHVYLFFNEDGTVKWENVNSGNSKGKLFYNEMTGFHWSVNITKKEVQITLFEDINSNLMKVYIIGTFDDDGNIVEIKHSHSTKGFSDKDAEYDVMKQLTEEEYQQYIEEAKADMAEDDESDSSNSSHSLFTNKFGTPTTKCDIAGCNNYIASSGDTNCCVAHSNKCGNCSKYIDGDAMYCMECLKGN